MSNNPNRHSFDPPTQYREDIDYSHLRPSIGPGEAMYEMNPFELFEQIGPELALEDNITAEEIVYGLQIASGRVLNNVDMGNMLSWANEEIMRYQDREKLGIMTPSQRIRHLYGVDIIFEDPIPDEAAG